MNKCQNCGIILDEGLTDCPLCGSNSEQSNITVNPATILENARKKSLRHTWELLGVVCLSGISASIALNLLFGGKITWSLYPATSIAWVWIAITISIFIRKKPFMVLILIMMNTLGMLLLFNAMDTKVNWFVPVGMPVTIVLFILIGIVAYFSSIARYKGFNILALAILAVNILCLSIEVFLDLTLKGSVSIRWSAVVSAALVPIVAVLMFLHYRLKKGRRLDSFFHI
jgi:hypothetical protein